jgi:hypothetical protein
MHLKVLLKKVNRSRSTKWSWSRNPKKMQLQDVEEVAKANDIDPCEFASQLLTMVPVTSADKAVAS